MYIETWNKVECPNCGIANWTCIGDLSDLTTIDFDGLRCWKCKASWNFDGEIVTGHEAYLDDGRKKPR